MKILLVNKLYAPDIAGGAEVTLANLAAGMQDRGHQVRVVTTTALPEVATDQVDGIDVTRLPLKNFYWHHGSERHNALARLAWHARDMHNNAMGKALGAAIADYAPDAIEFHNLAGFSAAAWEVAFAMKYPTVQVLHDYYNLCPRSQLYRDGKNCGTLCGQCRLFRAGRADLSNGLDAVIGVSHAILDAHVGRGLFSGVPLRRVINNAWAPQDVSKREPGATATTFGFIGALAEWKGIRRLLDAFRAAASDERLATIRLVVAGRGDEGYEAELRARYAGDRIIFLGRVPPATFYEQIDVCVVPSLWNDPLPSVVFEALLFGIPVIGSRRGGIPEMVSDRVNGLLYEPDDPGALEACIRELATVQGLSRRLGARALEGSAHFADIGRVVQEHLEVLEEAST